MDFEDLLVEVGEYGTYQKRMVYLFMMPATFIIPWYTMNTLFMVSVPDHWCNVPELERWNLTLEQQQLLIRPPEDAQCSMYKLNYTDLLESQDWNWTVPKNTSTVKCANGYRYDDSDYDENAATKWDLVCDRGHYNSMVLAVSTLGSIIGTLVYGQLSDKIGRKLTFYITIIVTLVCGSLSVLMTNFVAFAVFRAVIGTVMPAGYQLPIIMSLEAVGPNKRASMNGLAGVSWTIGLSSLPLVVYLCRDFVIFGLITSLIPLVFIFFWKTLPESPRWLLSQERYEDAADIMYSIAKTNGMSKSRDEILFLLKKSGEKSRREEETALSETKASTLDLFRYPKLRKHFIILTFLWVGCCMSYYGLQINVPNLKGNEFIDFFLLSVAECPGYFLSWFFMERWGRRWCSVFAMMLTGIILLVPIFYEDAGTVTSIIGKFGSSAAYTSMYQQSSELYPTPLRAIGMGISGAMNGVTALSVPYIVYLAEYGKFLPFLIISAVCLIVGIMVSFLPETLNEVLPQTVEDAENFGSQQKFFSWTSRKRPSVEQNGSFHSYDNRAATISESPKENHRNNGSQVIKDKENYVNRHTKS